MQKPSLGRIVIVKERRDPEPAVVINVRSEECVDVRLLGADPGQLTTGGETSVKRRLKHKEVEHYSEIEKGTWTWPIRV